MKEDQTALREITDIMDGIYAIADESYRGATGAGLPFSREIMRQYGLSPVGLLDAARVEKMANDQFTFAAFLGLLERYPTLEERTVIPDQPEEAYRRATLELLFGSDVFLRGDACAKNIQGIFFAGNMMQKNAQLKAAQAARLIHRNPLVRFAYERVYQRLSPGQRAWIKAAYRRLRHRGA